MFGCLVVLWVTQRNAKEASRVSLRAAVGSCWPRAQECSPLLGTNASFQFQSSLALKFEFVMESVGSQKSAWPRWHGKQLKEKRKATFFHRLWNLWFYSCVLHSTPGLFQPPASTLEFSGGESGHVAKSHQDRYCNFLLGQWLTWREGVQWELITAPNHCWSQSNSSLTLQIPDQLTLSWKTTKRFLFHHSSKSNNKLCSVADYYSKIDIQI